MIQRIARGLLAHAKTIWHVVASRLIDLLDATILNTTIHVHPDHKALPKPLRKSVELLITGYGKWAISGGKSMAPVGTLK